MSSITNVDELLQYLYKLKDSNSNYKFIAVNRAMDQLIRDKILQPTWIEFKAVIEWISWFTYIVSPYFKEQDVPKAVISQIDLNKVASINSVYEWESVFIEEILSWTTQITW